MASQKPLCNVPDCDRHAVTKDFCNIHYLRWKRHGTPHGGRKFRRPRGMTLDQILDMHLEKATALDTGCLNADCGTEKSKWYPMVNFQGFPRSLPRLYLERKIGRKLRKGECTRHICDNPRCINAEHLETGSQTDNVHDMWDRGRTPTIGETHPFAKLSVSAVQDMRRRHAEDGVSFQSLAVEYGASRSSVRNAILRKTWKHVP